MRVAATLKIVVFREREQRCALRQKLLGDRRRLASAHRAGNTLRRLPQLRGAAEPLLARWPCMLRMSAPEHDGIPRSPMVFDTAEGARFDGSRNPVSRLAAEFDRTINAYLATVRSSKPKVAGATLDSGDDDGHVPKRCQEEPETTHR
jgi:hypothetical protein